MEEGRNQETKEGGRLEYCPALALQSLSIMFHTRKGCARGDTREVGRDLRSRPPCESAGDWPNPPIINGPDVPIA